MNNLSIIGNLTADTQTRNVNDKSVCNFTVAVNRRGMKDKDGNNVADFFRISAWGKMGESCQKYLAKGRKVGVTGSVSGQAYTGNDGNPRCSLEVFATNVEFLTSGGEHGTDGGAVQPNLTPVETDGELQPNLTPVETDGELPF